MTTIDRAKMLAGRWRSDYRTPRGENRGDRNPIAKPVGTRGSVQLSLSCLLRHDAAASEASPCTRRRQGRLLDVREQRHGMDTDTMLREFSANRLGGDPVPEDLRRLLPQRDELAEQIGIE